MGVLYSHGIPAYGNKGMIGVTGDDTPSIYYTPYSIKQDSATINELLNKGCQLSNNVNINSIENAVEYSEGDVIIDCYGRTCVILRDIATEDLYISNEMGAIVKQSSKAINSTSYDELPASTVVISLSTSSATIDNEYNYIVSCNSTLAHHRDCSQQTFPAITLLFTLSGEIVTKQISNGGFVKLMIIFPDGYVHDVVAKSSDFTVVSETATCSIKLDYEYFYMRIFSGDDGYSTVCPALISEEFSYSAAKTAIFNKYLVDNCSCYAEYIYGDTEYRIKATFAQ